MPVALSFAAAPHCSASFKGYCQAVCCPASPACMAANALYVLQIQLSNSKPCSISGGTLPNITSAAPASSCHSLEGRFWSGPVMPQGKGRTVGRTVGTLQVKGSLGPITLECSSRCRQGLRVKLSAGDFDSCSSLPLASACQAYTLPASMLIRLKLSFCLLACTDCVTHWQLSSCSSS